MREMAASGWIRGSTVLFVIAAAGCVEGQRDRAVETRTSAVVGTADLTLRITGVYLPDGEALEPEVNIGVETPWDVTPPAVTFPCGTALNVPCHEGFDAIPDYLALHQSQATVFALALTDPEGYRRYKTVSMAGPAALDVTLHLSPAGHFNNTTGTFHLSIDPTKEKTFTPSLPTGRRRLFSAQRRGPSGLHRRV